MGGKNAKPSGPAPPPSDYQFIDQKEMEECAEKFKDKGIDGVANFLKQKEEDWKKIAMNIAVIGNSRKGKSSFINTARGLIAEDEGAAPVGVTQTTKVPTPYAHPKNDRLILWDLPGVGTPEFPKGSEYLKKIEFEKYDFFLIVSSEGFTENDLWLAEEIGKKNKGFFFVRTKVDVDVQGDKINYPKTHSTEKVLEKIRSDIKKNLWSQYEEEIVEGEPITNVFLINNHDRTQYDFEKLENRLIDCFPKEKKLALAMSLDAFSEDMVKRKAKILRGLLWSTAIASGLVALTPVPGINLAVDMGLILANAKIYHHRLGLDEKSVKQLAKIMSSDENELLDVVQKEVIPFLAMQGITQMIKSMGVVATGLVAEELIRFLPLVGGFLAAPISFTTTAMILHQILNKFEKAALQVVKTAMEGKMKEIEMDGNAKILTVL